MKIIAFSFGLILTASVVLGFWGQLFFIPAIFGLELVTILTMIIIGTVFTYYSAIGVLRIKKNEQYLFLSVLLVIISRIFSLLFNIETISLEQFRTVYSFVETLFILLIFPHIFSSSRNRNLFIYGAFIGVIIQIATTFTISLKFTEQVDILITNLGFIPQAFFFLICVLFYSINKNKLFSGIFGIIILVSLFTSQIRTALFSLILILIIGLSHLSRTQKIRFIATLAITIFLASSILYAILPSFTTSMFDRIILGMQGGGSVPVRYFLWGTAIGAFLQDPLIGIGSGSFVRQLTTLPHLFDVPLSDFYIDKYEGLGTHSFLLQVLCETGIFGLIPYFIWIIAIVVLLRKAFRLVDMTKQDDIYIMASIATVLTYLMIDIYGGKGSFITISTAMIALIMGWYREKVNRQKDLTPKYVPDSNCVVTYLPKHNFSL